METFVTWPMVFGENRKSIESVSLFGPFMPWGGKLPTK
jgi:hypothetical protein